MPFNNFPYTDVHNLNIDWLLETVKQMKADMEGLDVPAIVAAQIQEMVDDGTLGDLINNTLLANINTALTNQGLDIAALQAEDVSLDGRLDTLETFNTNLADYVIEEGTSGDWRYLKWNSGEIELWCQTNVTPVNDDVHGSMYFSEAIEVNLPIKVARMVVAGTAGKHDIIINPSATYEDQKVIFRLTSGSSISETSTTVNLYVRGEYLVP